MELYEYNSIIDYYSKHFHIYVSTDRRNALIRFHKTVMDITGSVDFESFCEHYMIEGYLNDKYPGMNLYNHIFSVAGVN